MSNPYYTYSGAFIPGILARAEAESTEFQAVQQGFALLATNGTDSGVADAYVVATQGGQNGVYADGMVVQFKAMNANTGASTISVDSGNTVSLTDFQGQSLAGGAIKANSWVRLTYNSTFSAWTLLAPTSQVITSNTISASAPTNKVGLVAAGGVSTACVPIDATYAIDQSIAPTWTGAHTFSNAVTFASTVSFSGGLSLTGNANQYAATLTGNSTSGQSLGLRVNAGTNASDFALRISNQSAASDYLKILGEGSIVAGSATGGGQGVGTINAVGLYVNGVAVLTSAASGANPTASVGLAAVNGSASTFLRSDGAPALSQAISPTWTGNHTWTPTSGVAQTVNAKANQVGISVVGGTNTANAYLVDIKTAQAAGFSSGVRITAATNASDAALNVRNAAATATLFALNGDNSGQLGQTLSWSAAGAMTIATPTSGSVWLELSNSNSGGRNYAINPQRTGIGNAGFEVYDVTGSAAVIQAAAVGTGFSLTGYGPVAAAQVDMTPDTGTFTGTLTGFTGSVTGTCRWVRVGKQVTLYFPAMTGTSNANSLTMTGLPSAIQPTRTQIAPPIFGQDASTFMFILPQFTASSGTVTFYQSSGFSTTFTASGTKGIPNASVTTYMLN